MAFNANNDFIIPMKKMNFYGYSFNVPDTDYLIPVKGVSKMPYVLPPQLYLDDEYKSWKNKPSTNPDHIANMATLKASVLIIGLAIIFIALLIG